jgi:hypothetical protein
MEVLFFLMLSCASCGELRTMDLLPIDEVLSDRESDGPEYGSAVNAALRKHVPPLPTGIPQCAHTNHSYISHHARASLVIMPITLAVAWSKRASI